MTSLVSVFETLNLKISGRLLILTTILRCLVVNGGQRVRLCLVCASSSTIVPEDWHHKCLIKANLPPLTHLVVPNCILVLASLSLPRKCPSCLTHLQSSFPQLYVSARIILTHSVLVWSPCGPYSAKVSAMDRLLGGALSASCSHPLAMTWVGMLNLPESEV